MTKFEKFVKCLKECDVDFLWVTEKEIAIPMPGYINNGNKIWDCRPISKTELAVDNNTIYESFFFSIHVIDDGINGISWSAVSGEDAE